MLDFQGDQFYSKCKVCVIISSVEIKKNIRSEAGGKHVSMLTNMGRVILFSVAAELRFALKINSFMV